MMLKKFLFFSVLIAGFAISAGLINPIPAHAVTGSDWQAGRIIDDGIFFNGHTMSIGDIQNFLNAKVPTCDTNGTQQHSSGQSRAAYGTSRGYPPPYTCLKDYSQSIPSKSPDAYCAGGINGGTKSAAHIISDVAQACGVNPKALIVLLQKEQSLVTDEWPWSIQYRSATGYGCPDTAPCDAEYYGFFNQVYMAARQFKRYAALPNSYNFAGGRTSFVQYNPNSGCGGTNITMQNQATAGLYNYTPYQPNAAALNNLYGTGDGCSAYGNRNFWRIYHDWFGPTLGIANAVTMTNISQPDLSPARGQTVSYTVSFTNNLSTPLTLDAVGIVGRLGDVNNGPNRDFGWQGPVTLQPGVPQQFTFTTLIRDAGTIYVWPAANYQGVYAHYNNWGAALNAHQPNLSFVSPLSSSIANPVAGQTATLSATVRNNEDHPINLEAIGIPVRYLGQYNYDTGWIVPSGSLQPNATQAVSGNILLDKPGQYTAWLSAIIANQFTSLSSNLTLNVAKPTPIFGLTYTETPNPNPALGEDIAVKFKLKNNSGVPMTLDAVGVVGRYDNPYNGPNSDLGWIGPETFSVGEEKTYTSFVRNISELNNFYAWVAIRYQGSYFHYNNWGFLMSPHLPNISITSPLTVNSGNQPTVGQTVPVTVTIKNNEPKPIRYSALGIPARYHGVYNYDAVWQGAGTLAASGQGGDSVTLNGSITFDKSGPYTLWTSIYIQGRFITIGSVKNINL